MTPAETSLLIERYDELIPIMNAHVNGQEIQYYDNGCNKWKPCACGPSWDRCSTYRIKPGPTLRPYTDDEMKRQIGNVFVHKHSDVSRIVTEAGLGWVRMYNQPTIGAAELLEQYKQVDGSPCGVTE